MSKGRITDVLLSYWNEIRGDRPFPSVDDIKKEDLAQVWDDCFIMAVFPQVRQNGYRFTYTGKNLSGEYQADDGTFIKNIVVSFLDSARDHYDKVVESGKPLIEEDVLIKSDHDLKFRQIILPLGEGDEVTAIIGGMRLRRDEL